MTNKPEDDELQRLQAENVILKRLLRATGISAEDIETLVKALDTGKSQES